MAWKIRAGSGERPPRISTRLRKGDNVLVIAGREKGKTGTILKVFPERNRATVERLNMVKRHRRGQGAQQLGGIVEKEAAIHLSNLMVISPKTNKPSRIGIRHLADGTKVRWSRRFEEAFDA